jgi:hypothetical protein
MAGKKVNIDITTTADTSGAKAAEKAIDEVKKSSTEAAAAAQSEAGARQKQLSQNITGFNGQIEALNKMKAAEVAAAKATKDHAKEESKLIEASKEYNRTLEEQIETEKRLQREADVAEATRRRDEREASGNGELKGIGTKADAAGVAAAGAAIAKSAQIASSSLRDTIREFQVLQKESGAAQTTYDTFLGSIADTIDIISSPIQALEKGLKSLAGLDDLKTSIDQAALMKQRLEEMITARKKLADDAREFALGFAVMRERQEIDATTAALERQLKVLAAKRSLMDAQGARSDAAAIASGADPNAVAAQALVRTTSSEIQALNEELALSAQSVEQAKAEAQSANNRFIDAFASGNKEATDAARFALSESENALSEAVADHEATIEVINTREAEIKELASTEAERLKQQGGEAITQSLEGLADSLEEKASEQGGQLSSAAKAGYDRILELINDSIPDSEQINEITRAMELVKRSQEGQGREIITGLNDLATVTATLQGQLNIALRQIQELRRQQQTPANIR